MLTSPQMSSQIKEIERLDLTWHEETSYDIKGIDLKKRVQVRDAQHYAPTTQVKQYMAQMRETVFPPIVMTLNGWIVDGNTRKQAKDKLGEKFGPVIVIEAEYGIDDKVDAKLRALAATLNQQGGQRLTTQEMKAVGLTLLVNKWKPKEISRATGLSLQRITQLRKELTAEEKFKKIGFKDGDKLQPGVKRLFGSAEATVLNDVPYKKTLELARDANLNSQETREFIKAMRVIGSDAGMIAFIDGKRNELDTRINEHGKNGNGKPSIASQLRRHLGFILKQKEDPGNLVELAPAAMENHFNVLKLAIDILTEAKKEQGKLINA